jgi:hypothetical protein
MVQVRLASEHLRPSGRRGLNEHCHSMKGGGGNGRMVPMLSKSRERFKRAKSPSQKVDSGGMVKGAVSSTLLHTAL